MLPSRPVIFISAVSKELRGTRDLVAKTLLAMGYEPKWQDIAPTETGDLRAVLRKWVDQSHAVLQIVGHRYGHAPKAPDETFGPVSYTQYEALYARAKGKTVYYILLDENHPVEPAAPQPAELQNLQAAYRDQVKTHQGLHHTSDALLTTENIVLRLRDDLARLRRGSKQLAIILLGLLLLALGGIAWNLMRQEKTSGDVATLREQNRTLLAALRDLPSALSAARQTAPREDEAARLARAYASLEESFRLPPGSLEKQLPAIAERLLAAPDTPLIDRANAEFVLKNYADAEKTALQAKDAALAAAAQPTADAIAALRLAGQAATEQTQYARALAHHRAAAALTSAESDVLAWAEIQNEIGCLLHLDGKYNEQASLMHRVWQACEKAGHAEHPVSLRSRHLRSLSFSSQGKHAEAEAELRAVLAIQERVLGPEHPDTLTSRSNLATNLWFQGKRAEAEAELRAVSPLMQRVLGDEHPDTLKSRNNLAIALNAQGKIAEAEAEIRAVLAIQERIAGPEHPNTLSSRNNLAAAVDAQGKHAEAEAEYRAVLSIRERVLGPEHPHTLSSCYNLSLTLENLGRKAEALALARRALAGWTKVHGPDHPDTLDAKQQVDDLEKQ